MAKKQENDVLNGLSRQEFEDYLSAALVRFPKPPPGTPPKAFEIRVADYDDLVKGVTAIRDDENGGVWVPGWVFVSREEMLDAAKRREAAAAGK